MRKTTLTLRRLGKRYDAITECVSFDDVARLLHANPLKLMGMAMNPQYREFYIPKKDGSKRLIEDPVPILKQLQNALNDLLQAAYYFNRSDAAYGFVTAPVEDVAPRHVLSNALRHLGTPWLLNMDMEDFFHTVSREEVQRLFQGTLFSLDKEAAELLAHLVCFKDRLPMGAPTSPVLSNFATIPLDKDLLAIAATNKWTYTRYADDMSFSADQAFSDAHIQLISNLVHNHGFKINTSKTKRFGPDDPEKEVTGILVGGKAVQLPPDYFPNLESTIETLRQVMEAQVQLRGTAQPENWVLNMQQRVSGKLNFARDVLGDHHPDVARLSGKYADAVNPLDEYGPIAWLEWGYDITF